MAFSSTDVGDAAEAARQDGIQNDMLESLAQCGQSSDNKARSLDRFLTRSGVLEDLEPYVATIASKIDGKPVQVCVPMILPHETVSFFYTNHPDVFTERFIGPNGAEG